MLAVNAIPAYGVIAQHWDGFAVIILYMLETIIIGLFHAMRMLLYRVTAKDSQGAKGTLAMILFFMFHFNFFIFVQSVLLFGFAGGSVSGIQDGFNIIHNYSLFLREPYLISIYAFIGSQIVYTGNELFVTHSYENMTIDKYMFLPYTRIFIQQFVVIIGAFIYLSTGSMEAIVILLIILKTGAEYLGQRFGDKWIVPKTK